MEIGVKNVELCADGAFSMLDDEASKMKVEKLLGENKLIKGKYITLSISSVVEKYCEKNGLNYKQSMKELIDYLNQRGYKVFLIANAARKGKVKPKNNDLVVCEQVYNSLKNKSNCIWIAEEFTPEVIREIIGSSKVLIASRFHAMIGALEKSIPVLLIGWSHKYKEVLDMFHVGEYATDYKSLKVEDIITKFESIEKDYEELQGLLKNNLEEVKKSSYKNIEIILDKIETLK
jgi:polysaccharide pyruvyl transferase WcaK-like protein